MLNHSRSILGLVLILTTILSGANAIQGAMLSWNVGGNLYGYRQEITVSSAVTGSDLTDYPLLVQLTDAGNPVFTNAIDGTDIIFTADDGVTQLSRDIETFTTGGSPELNAWVKTDVSSSLDTKIFMYYNGPSEANSEATWDSSYKLIQHLQEDPSGTSFDSTSSNNDGTNVNTVSATGRIGAALDFDGTAKVNLGTDSSLYPTTLTLEAWVKTDAVKGLQGIFTNRPSTPSGLNLQIGTTNDLSSLLGNGAGGQSYVGAAGTDDPVVGEWYHLAITHDGGTESKFYVNGELKDTNTTLGLGYVGSSPVQLGNFYSSGGNSLPFFGIIDEVRLSDSVRSIDWIAAQSLLVNNPGLLSFSAEELPPVPEPSSLLLLGLGTLGLMRHIRRRRKA